MTSILARYTVFALLALAAPSFSQPTNTSPILHGSDKLDCATKLIKHYLTICPFYVDHQGYVCETFGRDPNPDESDAKKLVDTLGQSILTDVKTEQASYLAWRGKPYQRWNIVRRDAVGNFYAGYADILSAEDGKTCSLYKGDHYETRLQLLDKSNRTIVNVRLF